MDVEGLAKDTSCLVARSGAGTLAKRTQHTTREQQREEMDEYRHNLPKQAARHNASAWFTRCARTRPFLSALSAGIVFFVALNLTPMAVTMRGFLPISRVDRPSSLQKSASKPTHHKASCDPSNFLVMIKAGAARKYHIRREVWRNSTCPELYRNNSVRYRFMLGMPAHKMIDPTSHNQAKRADVDEIEDMERLEKEATEHRDIEFLALKDVYEVRYSAIVPSVDSYSEPLQRRTSI